MQNRGRNPENDSVADERLNLATVKIVEPIMVEEPNRRRTKQVSESDRHLAHIRERDRLFRYVANRARRHIGNEYHRLLQPGKNRGEHGLFRCILARRRGTTPEVLAARSESFSELSFQSTPQVWPKLL